MAPTLDLHGGITLLRATSPAFLHETALGEIPPLLDKLSASIAQADRAHVGLGLGAHSARVAAVTRALCHALGLGSEEVQQIADASYFHDVGKLSLPLPLLLEQRPLSAAEYSMIADHAPNGATLLAGDPSHCAQTAARIARWHHQRYDGSGYPGGLAQTDIPLEARIVALADVYDAIRSKRPYKAPKCHADAMKALAHGDERIGPGAFDPVILEAFGDLQYTISQTWDCAALRLLADSLRDRAMA